VSGTTPAPVKTARVFGSKHPESQVTALALAGSSASGLLVAVGLGSGYVYLLKADLSSGAEAGAAASASGLQRPAAAAAGAACCGACAALGLAKPLAPCCALALTARPDLLRAQPRARCSTAARSARGRTRATCGPSPACTSPVGSSTRLLLLLLLPSGSRPAGAPCHAAGRLPDARPTSRPCCRRPTRQRALRAVGGDRVSDALLHPGRPAAHHTVPAGHAQRKVQPGAPCACACSLDCWPEPPLLAGAGSAPVQPWLRAQRACCQRARPSLAPPARLLCH
jgi:hypothetical protein